jgi:hypothetical protein
MKSTLVMAAVTAIVVATGVPVSAADLPNGARVDPRQTHLAQVLYNAHLPVHRVGWAPYGWIGAATPASSYARGLAALMRARGDYNLLSAEARIAHAEARRREIENRVSYTEAYFTAKELNREYRARLRPPRPSLEDLIRYAESARPDPLAAYQLDPISGEIRWPILLRTDRFAGYRSQLEALFEDRARSEELNPTTYFEIHRTTKAMLAALERQVRYVPQMDYVAAKRFIKSLAYEIRRPEG